MRLVVFGSGHPFRGGVARATTELVQALEARGHELRFLTPTRQYPRWLFPGVDDRDPEACPRLGCAEAVLEPLNPTAWPRSRRVALAHQADAWIVPYWTWAWAPMWWFVLRGPHPPAVAVVHNPTDHDAGMRHRLAARTVLKRCRALFTHARILETELAKAYPGRPTASYPLPPAAVGPLPDAGLSRARLGLRQSGRVLVFLGLIRPYKGLEHLLQAMARLPEDSDWQLLVAGEPWGVTASDLEARVEALAIADRVRLHLGWVPEPEVPVLLAAADLVALPYLRGSQSAVAPLALGAGVPVLSTRVGGLPEIIRHGTDGWLVAPGSATEIATALETIDHERLAALAAGARESAGRFTWAGYAAALEALIEQVVTKIPQREKARA